MNNHKQQLRKAMRLRLDALSSGAVAEASRRVRDRLLRLPAVTDAPCVALFAAFDHELDLSSVAEHVCRHGGRVAYPRWRDRAHGYELVAVEDPRRQLVPGRWGILEPPAELAALPPDVCRGSTWIVPGLAFDETGGRLGRGGGFYDRLLADTHGPRLAVAFDWQVTDPLPLEAWDQRMDWLVTDRRLLNVHRRNTTKPLEG